jgi:hypothetical protein
MSLFVSNFPLRVRFSLVVALIVASVIGALWWLSLRMGDRQGQATLWFALSGVLLVTLLVDQAARLPASRSAGAPGAKHPKGREFRRLRTGSEVAISVRV